MRVRIIDKDQAGTPDRWDFPSVDATAADALRGAQKGGAHLLTAGQLDALQKQVHEEAHRRGFEEGIAAGKAELASRTQRLAALADAFAHPFGGLERAVEDEIVSLAVELASHLVRREIQHDPNVLHAAIADCLGALASTVRDVTIYLHPDDAALVRTQQQTVPAVRFTVAEDASLQRGDLRVQSASSLVDGTLRVRCAEIVAAARAGARADQTP
jgi:flagellar assembly protein FliH